MCRRVEPRGCVDDEQRLELLSLVRILTRVLPALFEGMSLLCVRD